MKSILLLSLLLPFLSCSSLAVKSSGRNPKPEGPLCRYEYKLSGTMMYPLEFYQVERDSTGAVRITWSDGGPEIRVIHGPEDFFEKAEAIFRQHKLHKLKASYLPRMTVYDGKMWSAYFRFEKNSVSAGGSNAYPPEKLRAGIWAVNDYINAIIDASSENDIIERRSYD